MELAPKYTIFFLMSLSFSYANSQGSDSCSSPLTLQSPIPFDTSSLTCVIAWASHDYVLRYTQSSSNVWNFLLSAPSTNAYVAIGFSTDGNMIGSSAVVGWVGTDGTSYVQKYFLGGKSPNLVTTEPPTQGLQIGNSSLLLRSSRIYMAFQYNGNSPSTRLLYAVGPAGRLPVSPGFQLSQHDDMTSTRINYATGSFQSQGRPGTSLLRSHGLLNMFGWAILMPIGAMVARYMRKWDPVWFYSHAIIQSSGFVLGLSGVICGLVLENRIGVSVSRHKGIGITVLVFGCLQVIAILARPNKDSKVRKYWNWYHFGLGRGLIFLATINVFYGIHLGHAGSGWNSGFAAALVTLFVVAIVLELRLIFRK